MSFFAEKIPPDFLSVLEKKEEGRQEEFPESGKLTEVKKSGTLIRFPHGKEIKPRKPRKKQKNQEI